MAWRHRWLLWTFTQRELRDRYAGSLAGAAWAVAHPLALLGLYAFVFTTVFRVQLPPSAGSDSFIAFVAITLWPWLMFSEGLQRGMNAVRANGGLIRKVAFPHRLVVYASVLSTFALHLLGYVVVLLALNFLAQPLHFANAPAALVVLAALFFATTGLAALLAAVQTLIRDTEQVIAVVIPLLFYATPILYPLQLVPERMKPWVAANPMSTVAERLRDIFLHGSGPAAADFILLAVSLLVLAVGLWFFERLSPFFEDFL